MIKLNDKVTFSNGAYYFRPRPNVRRIYLGNHRRDAEIRLREIDPGAHDFILLSTAGLRRCKAQLFGSMAARARNSNLACMTKEEFGKLWDRAGGRCELTALEFNVDQVGNCVKRPWAPSVDRRDNSKGYEFDNCRLVCTAVNLALNEFGDETLIKIARALVSRF
jgi:hypothetical protein